MQRHLLFLTVLAGAVACQTPTDPASAPEAVDQQVHRPDLLVILPPCGQ